MSEAPTRRTRTRAGHQAGVDPAGPAASAPDELAALSPALLAAAVLAVDPGGLGGVVVRGDAWLAQAWTAQLLALAGDDGRPMRTLPLSATPDRVCGGLDLAATLQARRPVMQPGLLAEAHGGWLLAASAERIGVGVAAEVCAALDRGWVEMARDGLAARSPARFAVLALDEGRDAQEAASAALCERLALYVELDGAAITAPDAALSALVGRVAAARTLLPAVLLGDASRRALCAAAMAVGEPSLRAARFCCQTARILAALRGRRRVDGSDVADAAALVLASRARRLPEGMATPEPQAAPPDAAPTDTAAQDGANDPPQSQPSEQSSADPPPTDQGDHEPQHGGISLQDLAVAAVRAALPDGVLVASTSASGGKGGGRRQPGSLRNDAAAARGAPAGVRRTASPRRLSLVDTLKAAAPWQRLRNAGPAGDAAARVQVRPGDFRTRIRKPPQRGAVLFVVDASGSAAAQRLAEAKGAVELLLADCYARRDQVALISFRQAGAEVLLPPTRSLTRVRRRLGDLAAGGATPLAHAIEAGGRLASGARERGERPLLVFMSDARANLARSGLQGRAAGAADALAAARDLAVQRLDSVFIDISPRGEPQADAVAAAMGARYLRLPHVQAEALAQAVRKVRDGVRTEPRP